MHFCSLKVQNLVLKIDLVNRRWVDGLFARVRYIQKQSESPYLEQT